MYVSSNNILEAVCDDAVGKTMLKSFAFSRNINAHVAELVLSKTAIDVLLELVNDYKYLTRCKDMHMVLGLEGFYEFDDKIDNDPDSPLSPQNNKKVRAIQKVMYNPVTKSMRKVGEGSTVLLAQALHSVVDDSPTVVNREDKRAWQVEVTTLEKNIIHLRHIVGDEHYLKARMYEFGNYMTQDDYIKLKAYLRNVQLDEGERQEMEEAKAKYDSFRTKFKTNSQIKNVGTEDEKELFGTQNNVFKTSGLKDEHYDAFKAKSFTRKDTPNLSSKLSNFGSGKLAAPKRNKPDLEIVIDENEEDNGDGRLLELQYFGEQDGFNEEAHFERKLQTNDDDHSKSDYADKKDDKITKINKDTPDHPVETDDIEIQIDEKKSLKKIN